MNRGILVVLLASLIIGAHSQAYQAVFAFSWYEGHCIYINSTGGCDPDKLALWDHQSFTIHGLWPKDKASKKYGNFSLDIIKKDPVLLDDMENYWPPQSRPDGSSTFLWEHEWEGHGHDYAEIIYRVQPQRFEGLTGDALEERLQYTFFHDVVFFYKKFRGVQRYPSAQLSKESFASNVGIQADQLTLSCPKGFLIREIKVCFDITPTGNKFKTCTNQANTGCKKGTDYELPAWKETNQERVIAKQSSSEEL